MEEWGRGREGKTGEGGKGEGGRERGRGKEFTDDVEKLEQEEEEEEEEEGEEEVWIEWIGKVRKIVDEYRGTENGEGEWGRGIENKELANNEDR